MPEGGLNPSGVLGRDLAVSAARPRPETRTPDLGGAPVTERLGAGLATLTTEF